MKSFFARASRGRLACAARGNRTGASVDRSHAAMFQPLERRVLLSAGDLDPTFGQNGRSFLGDTYSGENVAEHVWEAAALPDERVALLVTGTRRDRYDAGEKRFVSEPGFGVGYVDASGFLSTDMTSYFDVPIDPGTIVATPDGGLVLAGSANVGTNGSGLSPETRVAIYRWGSSAPPRVVDVSSQAHGSAVEVDAYASEALVQPDGKILVVGGADVIDDIGDKGEKHEFTNELVLLRFNPDLTLDRTFGGGDGIVVNQPLNESWELDRMTGTDLALTGDGHIVVLATNHRYYPDSGYPAGAYLVRFNPDGSPDAAFGPDTDGIVRIDPAVFDDGARQLAVLPGGKMLVAGDAETAAGSSDFSVARFNADGSVDRSFGNNGRVRNNLGANVETLDTVTDLAVLPDGKFLVAGNRAEFDPDYAFGKNVDVALARYTAGGALDPTFRNGAGVVVLDFSGFSTVAPSDDRWPALSVLADGRAVLASAFESVPTGIAATRIMGDATPQEQVLQAEAARLSGPLARHDNLGYAGTGYADFTNASGDFVEWTVTESAAAPHRIALRYANGSSDRPLELRVNGTLVKRVSFPSTGSWNKWGTVFADVPLQGGANTIRVTSVGSNGPNVDQVAVSRSPSPLPPPPPRERVYQAEEAAIVGAEVHRAYAGYTGSGYVDYVHTSGDSVEWSVTAAAAGTHRLDFIFALGSGVTGRRMELKVNGQVVNSSFQFQGTGSWSAWGDAIAMVPLRAGANTVRLTTNGSNGPNVDRLVVTPPPDAPAPQTLQAEDARLSGPTVRASNAGYTGGGYADFGDAPGQGIDWTANVVETRDYVLEFRYANGTDQNRRHIIKVDGTSPAGLEAAQPFAPTGSWSTWKTLSRTVRLTAGRHTIRLESIGPGVNIDALTIRPAP